MSKEYKQYSRKDKLPLKYACFQPEVREAIAKMSMPLLVKDHIDDLYDLITYQMKRQMQQEQKIVSLKHIDAWKKYEIREDQ
tara:strand:- start:21 stop:266 length:246 start_codon:yes stop_codon:yes gene_type:complete